MNILFLIIILFTPLLFASPVINKNEAVSECGEYTLKVVSYEFDQGLPEKVLSNESAGHFGNPYLVKQEFIYVSKKGLVSHPISDLWPKYERIDPERYYTAKIKQCSDNREATFSLWSGGNCRDVCEAWGVIRFSENGSITSLKGLSYPEFKEYNL